jgi:hypothetical protein
LIIIGQIGYVADSVKVDALVGLVAALPLASCTLVAAYRHLFPPGPLPQRPPRPPLPHQRPRNRF